MSGSDHDYRDEEHGSRFGFGSQIALLLLSLILYVLSIGPVVWLAVNGYLPLDPVVAFYTPVDWLHGHTPLEKPLEWYGALWGWN